MTKPLKVQPKPHKLPINPRTAGLAATTRSATWSSVDEAMAAVEKWTLTGIGFVFSSSDPYAGIDIDNCRNPETSAIADWAWKIIRALNSYTEVSPSGTGVHIIIRGKLPAGEGNQVAQEGGKVEMFSRARYFTFTGIHVDATPIEIFDRQSQLTELHSQLFAGRKSRLKTENCARPESPLQASDEELITQARMSRNGPKFERLWSGQWSGDYPSQSEADLSLCCLLAFWTGKDSLRMDALFRRSGLMRKKWTRKQYREETIHKALAATSEIWHPSRQSSPNGDRRRSQPGNEPGGRSDPWAGAPDSPMPNTSWVPPIPFHQFDLPRFPTDALPDWLREFVEAEATATQTPPDLAAMLSLSVVAAACAKKVIVEVKSGYSEPVNIFTVTALPSGTRKTAVFAAITKPMEEYEHSEATREAGEIARKQTALKIREARLKQLQDKAVNTEGSDREVLVQNASRLSAELASEVIPVPTRCIADDCTPEKLASLLRDQGGRIAVFSTEGDVFELIAGRYSANKTGNFAVYLKGHAGDTLRVDRIGRAPDFVQAPALTVGLAVQPDVIRELANHPGFRGRGLLGRFLYSLPVSMLGHRDTNAPAVPSNVRTAYHDNVLALLRIRLEKAGNGNSCPFILSLDAIGRERLREFEEWVEPQLAEFGELGGITDWAGKLVGAVTRITGLLHMAAFVRNDNSWQVPISDSTVQSAIRIGRYLIPHARAAFAQMGADETVEGAKVILRWITHRSLDSFTKRDAHQGTRGRFKRAEDLDALLAVLVDRGFIRKREEISSGPGRHASPTYEVNPLWVLNAQRLHDGSQF